MDADDSTELYFEAERVDFASQDALIWVNVPQIDAGSSSDFLYIYYGNPAATQSAYHSATDVWDSNFQMVLHLNENSGTHYDSTINDNDTDITGTPVQDSTGRIAGGIEFEGVANEWIATSSALDTTDEFTIELWGNYQTRSGYQTGVWYQTSGSGWRELITIDSSGNIKSWWNGGSNNVDLGTDWDYDEWHYYVFAYDGNTVYVYKDGEYSSQVTTNYNSATGIDHWKIGDRDDTNQPLDGTVDEYRFSITSRSGDWIEAQFLSMTDAFITYGVEEEANQPPNDPSNLGPTSYVDGSWGSNNTPTLTFDQTDPNIANTLKYTVQIDDSSDFSSPVVDYTSELLAQGEASFTVGEAAGAGSYATGSPGQTLPDGSYYWQVMSTDNNAATSGWSVANNGAVAFRVETAPQTGGASDSAGAIKDAFSTGDNVYATASGLFPSSNVDIYVVEDREWSNGDPIPADVGDGMDTTISDDTGNLGPVITWAAPLEVGEYDLVLDVNQDGFYDPLIDLVDDPNEPGFVVLPPPIAGFRAEPTEGVAPLEVQFTDGSSGSYDSWSWDFGDGGVSEKQNPSYVYTTPGTYTVSLTVSGLVGTDSETEEDYITVYKEVVASFSAEPTMGEAPLIVQFRNRSAGDYDSWSWRFGDGETSHARNPSHTYQDEGIYTVRLTVSGDGGGDTEVKQACVTVEAMAAPSNLFIQNLRISPVYAQPGQAITINAEVVNDGGTWGSGTVKLMINGQFEQSRDVGVSAGTAQPVDFTVYRPEPGTYQVDIGGATETFFVSATPASTFVTSTGLDTGGIIAIVIIGCILAAGIAVIVIFSRRPRS